MTERILGNNTVAVLLLATLLLVFSVLVLNWVRHPTMDAVDWREEVYHVRQGDSLWSLSRTYCPESVDRREWIDEIQARNGLTDSILHPGQRLIVLAVTKKEVQR